MYVLAASSLFLPSFAGAANPFNELIKPGDLIEGHSDFESDCSSCHTKFRRSGETEKCRACHEQIDADINNKKGFHGRAPEIRQQECRACHTDHEGSDANIAKFDHQTFEHWQTDFPLLGAHREQQCDACHAPENKFRDAPAQCIDCHEEDDKHRGELGSDCSECHTQRLWTEVRFDHETTGWPLLGRHQEAACESCHIDESYKDTATDCVACHREDDAHEQRFGTDCEACHVADDWQSSVFDHHRDTGYPLLGGHHDVTCNACHSRPFDSRPPKTSCETCHLRDDPHKGLRGKVCSDCHVIESWQETDFDHFNFSGFRLHGKHASALCESCHIEPADKIQLPQDCFACHRDEDPHKAQQGEQCDNCHNESGWKVEVVFDHSLTAFPLLGKHQQASCDSCHESAAFKDAETSCIACHENDDYHEGSLGAECAACHVPENWAIWQFDHAAATDFGLDGAHEALSCEACHADSSGTRLAAPDVSCVTCHGSDDVHFGEFGRRCERCHTTSNFTDTTLAH